MNENLNVILIIISFVLLFEHFNKNYTYENKTYLFFTPNF